ncbi:hypothetical protein C8Q79DRAFT_980823 [Trametes meyenii]|nr:hypothetical protein C8Q79DRAFT_980823 [Trametes meyenii]
MPSASVKRSTHAKSAKRQQPYDASQRAKARQAPSASLPISTRGSRKEPIASFSSGTPSSSPTTSTGASISSSPCTSRPLRTTREVFQAIVQKHYPSFVPRNDWELVHLSGGAYRGHESGLYEYLDATLAARVKSYGSYEKLMDNAKSTLEEVVEFTGLKPIPGGPHDPHVLVQPIPGCEYSIRLFPGSLESSEYCLDFVDSRTGEPVNSPIKFDLISVPDPNGPIGSGPTIRLRPLECAFGISRNKIKPGEEKFLLRDGQHYVLRRLGHRDVRFTVPIRRRPQAVLPVPDADFLPFPKYLD